MIRSKSMTKEDIIYIAKSLEWGDKWFKIDNGSVTEALIAARYHMEYGMSKEEYNEKQYKKAKRQSNRYYQTSNIVNKTCSQLARHNDAANNVHPGCSPFTARLEKILFPK